MNLVRGRNHASKGANHLLAYFGHLSSLQALTLALRKRPLIGAAEGRRAIFLEPTQKTLREKHNFFVSCSVERVERNGTFFFSLRDKFEQDILPLVCSCPWEYRNPKMRDSPLVWN